MFKAFSKWLAIVEKQTGNSLDLLQSDTGGEYFSDGIKRFIFNAGYCSVRHHQVIHTRMELRKDLTEPSFSYCAQWFPKIILKKGFGRSLSVYLCMFETAWKLEVAIHLPLHIKWYMVGTHVILSSCIWWPLFFQGENAGNRQTRFQSTRGNNGRIFRRI